MTKTSINPIKLSSQTKTDKILNMLRRNAGATVIEIAKATSWQRYSVHGFMSGTLKKKLGFETISTKEASGDRRYRIKGGAQ
jgi:Protein of unknown function (DUF3489)